MINNLFVYFSCIICVCLLISWFILHSEPCGDVKDLSAEEDTHTSVALSEAATSESRCEFFP